MSADWDVYCVDCDDGMGLNNWDHHEDDVLDACNAAPVLALLARTKLDMIDGIRPSSNTSSLDLSFFLKHEGHRLRPRSEYGEIMGSCGKRILCQACKQDLHEKCRLDPGHAGPCSTKAEP